MERYLLETLGTSVKPRHWENSSKLPQYLRERYRFFRIDVLGTECVLMVDNGDEEQTPAVIGKHLDQVRGRGQFEVVYVRQGVTSYNRRRLIEQKVPFIVPGNQMYLPMLGIDLREHVRRLREKKPVFSPSTQALILQVLWHRESVTITPAEMAHRLGYSAMTMTRAFDELETAGVGEHSVTGRERHLRFSETGRSLWEHVLPYLNTPVRKRLYIASSVQAGDGSVAGESALAYYTMLAEPRVPVLAFSSEEWKVWMQHDKLVELVLPEPGAYEIELWKYAPALFAREGNVDRLSLYLSLRDSTDERVQAAMHTLVEDMEW
ncbi:MAG: MarR family transcriptional regulator [Actinomycetota bacterium]